MSKIRFKLPDLAVISVEGGEAAKAAKAAEAAEGAEGEAEQVVADEDPDGLGDEEAPCNDVVFLLFLEPPDENAIAPPHQQPSQTFFEKAVNFCVRSFQESPVLLHVEMAVPTSDPDEPRTNFATYIGEKSSWQVDPVNSLEYYFNDTAARWRCVPVFSGRGAAAAARATCSKMTNVPYSLGRYVTSALPFRGLSGLVPDAIRSPGHCATLTARALAYSGTTELKHGSNFYGPSSLYAEMAKRVPAVAKAGSRVVVHPPSRAAGEAQAAESTGSCSGSGSGSGVCPLVDGPLDPEAVHAAGDVHCLKTLNSLSRLVGRHPVGSEARRADEKRLATAVLRWAVLRRMTTTAAAEAEATATAAVPTGQSPSPPSPSPSPSPADATEVCS